MPEKIRINGSSMKNKTNPEKIKSYKSTGNKQPDSENSQVCGTEILSSIDIEQLSASQVTEIIRNIKILKKHSSDGIMKVNHIQVTETKINLFLENFDGIPLKQYIKMTRIKTHNFLDIAFQLAATLQIIHNENIETVILTSENILINPVTLETKFFGLLSDLNFTEKDIESDNPLDFKNILPYLSPEQIRKKRIILTRTSNIYNLGIILFELATSKLPFFSRHSFDLMELKLSQIPLSPSEINHDIPRTVSDIIIKLIEKKPDNRYSGCDELKYDINRCLTQLQTKGHINSFKPGDTYADNCINLQEKYYGRESEINLLLSVFEKVLSGGKQFLIVTGPSGIGKTTLVQKIFEPLIMSKCTFITGKCDQMNEDMPYNPLIQAFRQFINSILNEPEEIIHIWKEGILEKIGNNGQIIIDVIPEIEQIIGPQKTLVKIDSRESRNRFNLVFTNFIRVFSDPRIPLVIFLDDLQWVDPATLGVIKNLTIDPKITSIFFIGSYRDNEVSEYHSLSLAVNEIKSAGAGVTDISLAPLSVNDICRLIKDRYKCKKEKADHISEFIFKSTKGNPFFIIQLLRSFQDSGLIHYNPAEGWMWDFDEIKTACEADSMGALMSRKISEMNSVHRKILMHASCLGNTFNPETLAMSANLDIPELEKQLKEISDTGLIMPSWEGYKFTHDKIYESALSLIPAKEKKLIHYKLGKILLDKTEDEIDENIFVIVNQLNLASDLIDDNEKKYVLSHLNLKAGTRAVLSVAYTSAINYFQTSIDLLPENCWAENYELTMQIHIELFQCRYLTTSMVESYRIFNSIMENARTDLEKAGLYNINAVLLSNSGKPAMAIMMGIAGLKHLGINLKSDPSRYSIFLQKIWLRFKFRRSQMPSLSTLPDMTGEEQKQAMEIFLNLWMPANHINFRLRNMITINMIRFSLNFGNCEISPFAYMASGIMLTSETGNFNAGHLLALQSLKMADSFNNRKIKARVEALYGSYLAHFKNHADTDILYLKEAYNKSIEAGDFYNAGFAAIARSYTMVMKGDRLDSIHAAAGEYLDFTMKIKNFQVGDALVIILRIIKQLRGKTENCCSLSDSTFNEKDFIESMNEKEVIQPLYLYKVLKSRTLYLFGKYCEALDILPSEKEITAYHFSTFLVPERNFLHSLAITALYNKADTAEKNSYMKILINNQKKMKAWSDNCPENFYHKYLLISAEIMRISGNDPEAIKLYNMSIRSAGENRFTNNEALANELAGRFYFGSNHPDAAALFFNTAISCYNSWGAYAKCSHLKLEFADKLPNSVFFPDSTEPDNTIITHSGIPAISEVMDLIRPVLNEHHLPAVLEKILTALIKITDASCGFLLLNHNGRLFVEAGKHVDSDTIKLMKSVPLNIADFIPASIIKHTAKTLLPVILTDPENRKKFVSDPHLIKNRHECILCLPLISNRELVAISYIECPCTSDNDFKIIHDLLHLVLLQGTASITNSIPGTPDNTLLPENSLLKDIDTDTILSKLNYLMEKEKLYSIEDLTLSMVSKELLISNQQLSVILNEKLNVNFNNYINRFRVNEAAQMLVEHPKRPVLSIAYDVGFNSVSTFYNAFLKFSGKSPARFRKEKLSVPGII